MKACANFIFECRQSHYFGKDETQQQKMVYDAHLVDIFLLPNFCKFIKPFIDTSFGRTHKEEYTQHQWRFKAVRPDRTYFPRGVKVTYKKYSSDKLVIIEKKPAQLCRRIEGQMTGLESTTINS